MRVRSLGHAGLEIATDGGRVLIDPWLSPEGAFQGSWFPFPDNAHLVDDHLLRPDAIVITHEHLDHLDPWVLERVPGDIPAVIPRYPSAVLLEKVLACGPRPIVEIAPWEVHEIVPGTELFFVSEESPMNHDSAVVMQAGAQTLLNINDARLSPLQFRTILRRVQGRVDVLAFQGAGASWYPMCYRYDDARRAAASREKREAKLRYTASCMAIVDPVVGIPFAGPPAFLDPELFIHNREMDGGIFPDPEEVAAWLAEQGHERTTVLLPGDVWDVDTGARERDLAWEGFDLADHWPYLEAYARRRAPFIEAVHARYPVPAESLWPAFERYFTDLLELSPYFNEHIGMRVGFVVTGPAGGTWSVDFRPGHEAVLSHAEGCGYTHQLEDRWLAPILRGEVPWEDFLLSLRFEAWRDPDIYNDYLLGLLKFADKAALDEVESWERSLDGGERFVLHDEGRAYSLARRCPHAGNDLLETGEVLAGGVIRCLAHYYEFSLETGECVNGRCRPLSVEPAEVEKQRY